MRDNRVLNIAGNIKIKQHLACLSLFLFATSYVLQSATFQSAANNKWNTAATWTITSGTDADGVPDSDDDVTIQSGHTVTMDGNTGDCNSLTIIGTAFWSSTGFTTNVGAGGLTMQGGIITGSRTGVLNTSGNFTVNTGVSNLGRCTFVVSGTTTLDGELIITSSTGTKSFASITVNPSGTWNPTITINLLISGSISTGGSFTCNSGTYTVSGNLSVTGGTTDFEGSVGGTFSVSSGATLNASTGTFSVTGTSTISGAFNISTTTGTKNFSDVFVNSGGSWNCSVTEPVTITGNVTTAGNFDCNSGTYTVNGNFSITGGTTNYEGSIGGALTISSGAILNAPTGDLSVTGSTSISGSLNFTSATGTKSFVDITINSGGTWNSSVAEGFTIAGNFKNDGTFISNSGTYTFTGISKTFSGNNTCTFDNISISGAYTNSNRLRVNTNMGGTGSLTQGINSLLEMGDPSPPTLFTASASGNKVYYFGTANQSVSATTYHDIEIASTGGTVTATGTYTINNDFIITSGTVTFGSVTVSGLLSVASGSVLNIGNASPSINGSASISGTVNVTSTLGTKTFNNLTVNTGGNWNITVAESFTINGDLSNSGTFTANNGTYTLAGAGKTISGTFSIPTITVSGSYTNNGTLSSTTTLSGSGTFTQGSSGILTIEGATFSVSTFNASASGNTVNYNSTAAQNVRLPNDNAYHHLTISGSGIKTLLANTVINGDLTISSTLDVSASNFAITLGGNWLNTGTFTPGTGDVTLNGSGAQSITKSGGETFYTLTLSGSGTKTLGSAITTNQNLTINSTLDVSASNYSVTVNKYWTNNGSFIPRNGTVSFTGSTAQVIGGTAITTFTEVIMNNTSGISLAKDANLTGTLSLNNGTFTTSGYIFTLISNASGTARIGPISVTANLSGDITMQRYLPTGTTGWKFLGSCVSGGSLAGWNDDYTMSGFPGSNSPSFSFVSVYTYDETVSGAYSNGYIPASNITNAVTPGKGYWMYIGPLPVSVDVAGPPSTFNQTFPVSYTSSSGGITADGWNMLANPYPSQIDWDAATGWTKTNIDNAIYIWNADLQQYASYVAGFGTNGGSNIIPSSQGFWVKANDLSPVLSLTENVKSGGSQPFIRMAGNPAKNHFVRLRIYGNNYSDETFIQFNPDASDLFDTKHDAYKLYSSNNKVPSIASLLDTTSLSVNSYALLTAAHQVPVKVKTSVSGNYTLRWDSVLNMPASSCILLKDLYTGNLIDMRTISQYTFSLSDTTKSARFILLVEPGASSESFSVKCHGESNGTAIAKGAGTGPWAYEWKNNNGVVIKNTASILTPDTINNLPAGMYTIRITDSLNACGNYSDTIRVTQPDSLRVTMQSENVSCYGKSDGSVEAIINGGTPSYALNWSNGNSTGKITGLTPGTYSISVADKNGCVTTSSITLSEPALVQSAFTASSDTVYLSGNTSVQFTNLSSGGNIYTWDFGDGSALNTKFIPDDHNYEVEGNYTVLLKAANGNCADSSFKTITVINDTLTAGIHDPTINTSLKIEQTNSGVFLLYNLPGEKNSIVSIFNISGQKIAVDILLTAEKGKLQLPLPEEHTRQLYLIRIQTGKGTIVKRSLH